MTLWGDPGGMTGLAWLWDGGISFMAFEWDFQEACDRIETTCRNWGPSLAIGYERYTIRPGVPQTHAYTAIETIGVIKHYARRYRCHLLDPGPQHTPTTADRRELEAIGWWVKGKNDAQSAAWHMLAYCRRSGNLPPRVSAILSDRAGTL